MDMRGRCWNKAGRVGRWQCDWLTLGWLPNSESVTSAREVVHSRTSVQGRQMDGKSKSFTWSPPGRAGTSSPSCMSIHAAYIHEHPRNHRCPAQEVLTTDSSFQLLHFIFRDRVSLQPRLVWSLQYSLGGLELDNLCLLNDGFADMYHYSCLLW